MDKKVHEPHGGGAATDEEGAHQHEEFPGKIWVHFRPIKNCKRRVWNTSWTFWPPKMRRRSCWRHFSRWTPTTTENWARKSCWRGTCRWCLKWRHKTRSTEYSSKLTKITLEQLTIRVKFNVTPEFVIATIDRAQLLSKQRLQMTFKMFDKVIENWR